MNDNELEMKGPSLGMMSSLTILKISSIYVNKK